MKLGKHPRGLQEDGERWVGGAMRRRGHSLLMKRSCSCSPLDPDIRERASAFMCMHIYFSLYICMHIFFSICI